MRFCQTRMACVSVALALALSLSGCAPVPMLPGREPFGEQTASSEKTGAVYQEFLDSFQQEALEDWNGFSVSWHDLGENCDVDIYRTEEYTLAYCEYMHHGEYLWYDGWLYWWRGDSDDYREMAWEELQSSRITAGLWAALQEVLQRAPEEMIYKYIPLAKESGNLLTVTYALPEEETGDSAKLTVPIHKDGHYESVGFLWQDVGELGEWNNVTVDILFFPFAGSNDLLAERKLWSFGTDCGLLEEGVPAISEQNENREQCREVIAGMDFDAFRKRAVRQEDLVFPAFPDQCLKETEAEG